MIIEKTYEVTYLYGVINPVEKTVDVTCLSYPDEKYIRDEIVKKRNLKNGEENQIVAILSCLLKSEKPIDNGRITLESLGL